jgi:signal transduction histidine kinase/ActR/RegA family two-component response regulator
LSEPINLLTLDLRTERDVVIARQRVRIVAEQLGFEGQDQIRIATACSEIARNAQRYAAGGRIECSLTDDSNPSLRIVVSDQGKGIKNLDEILDGRYQSSSGMGMGLIGSRRLMDRFNITTGKTGTIVQMEKHLPRYRQQPRTSELKKLIERAVSTQSDDLSEEVQRQNHALIVAMEQLQVRQAELERLNRELDDTNRGVVALYGELDERAALLERASELKSRFLSNMSHEFRTPLNSIISLSALLLDRVDGDLSGEQEKQVTFIRRSAESLLEMVNDLLDLAKIEAGKVDVRSSEFSVEEIFGALRGMLRPLITNPNVALTFEQVGEIPRLFSDETKLSQILRNFISNALKFTSVGEVAVTAEHGMHDTVIFSVRDTGLGIATKDLSTIFEEFTQIENELQRKSKGTGLGLPLSRKLAELLGGEVSVKSEVGKGSTFSVVVPRQFTGQQTISAGRVHVLPASGKSVRLLLVDDDEIARYVLRSLLSGLAVEIVEVISGFEVQKAVRKQRPDAIFLDLVMPGMSGLETLRLLKQDPESADIPVIVHTSKILDASEREEILRYAVDIIPKMSSSREDSQAKLSAALARAGLTKAISQER